jgi:nitrogen-specific signal transduction histidine kinase
MLFPILGNAELLILKSVAFDNDTKENLTQLYESALQAKELVQQILNFSRHKKIQRRPLQIQNSIDTVLKLMKSGIPRNISIENDVDPGCPPVAADSTQLHQIIMNLISNGVHAMGKTGGVITVSLKPVTVSQADAGWGQTGKLYLSKCLRYR